MRSVHVLLLASAALVSASAGAQPATIAPATTPATAPAKPAEPVKPVTQREPDAADVVATPITDLNMRKDEIPQVLLDAQLAPYSLRGLTRCNRIGAEVARLDTVLGDDIDIAQYEERRLSAGKVAQSVVGGLIPFRGLIRELSGANEHERRFQAAIYAGYMRRSFLKGIGQQRGCGWPARSATPEMLAKIALENEAKARARQAEAAAKASAEKAEAGK